MDLKKKIRNAIKELGKKPFVYELAGSLAYIYAWIIGKTSSFELEGQEEFEKLIEENDGGIFVAWHGRLLILPFFWRNTRLMKALVSPHQDGRIIAKVLRKFNIGTIDGSSDRQALGAALEIRHELDRGTVVALIPDGPKGPSMRLKKSVIYFAQKSGKPIMGFTYSVNNSYVAGSWDSMMVPYPFCKGKIRGTKPMFVPKDLTSEEAEALRQKFEDELNALTLGLDKEFDVPEIVPGKSKRIRVKKKVK
jgi:lysophospholipid acyltransferase (LPLAT)-like uncharacterized protein